MGQSRGGDRVGQQHGQRPTTGSSPKYQEPSLPRSPPPIPGTQNGVRMSCGKNLLDPGEKKGPSAPHCLSPLFSGGCESCSLSHGDSDTAGDREAPASLGPAAGSPTPGERYRYHMILCISCLPFPVGGVSWSGVSWTRPLPGRVLQIPQHSRA